MTKRECAVIMAFTGVTMLKGDDLLYFYEYVYEIMGRPLLTHELPKYADEIKESARPDFIQLCRNATEADALEVAKEDIRKLLCSECGDVCQFCKHDKNENALCAKFGGHGSWCCENAAWRYADGGEADENANRNPRE